MNTYYIIIIVLILIILVVFFLSQKKTMISKEGYKGLEIDNFYPQITNIDFPVEENLEEEVYFQDELPLNDFPVYINPIERRYQELENSYRLPVNEGLLFPHRASIIQPFSVTLKNRNKDYSLASVIRGDVPIVINPDIPLIGKSRYLEYC